MTSLLNCDPRLDDFDAVYKGNRLFEITTQPAVSRTFDLFRYVILVLLMEHFYLA